MRPTGAEGPAAQQLHSCHARSKNDRVRAMSMKLKLESAADE
jgi:hypothetical protein